MNRRTLLSAILAILWPPPPPKTDGPQPCVTPACAGFDGSFRIGGRSSDGLGATRVVMRHCPADSPNRISGIRCGEFAVWKNPDRSVSKLMWKSPEGRLFELKFVPFKEESA